MITQELESIYLDKVNTFSDINEHLPTLKEYASQCDVVAEFGVRSAISTWALLAAKPKKLISVDWVPLSYYNVDEKNIERIANENNIQFEFRLETTVLIPEDKPVEQYQREIPISDISKDAVDLLFIDSNHVYSHLQEEFKRHAQHVKKYIMLHDTTLCADIDGNGNRPGLWQAIEEFLKENTAWKLKDRFTNNNGLTVLERV
jgi:hypothetical protein